MTGFGCISITVFHHITTTSFAFTLYTNYRSSLTNLSTNPQKAMIYTTEEWTANGTHTHMRQMPEKYTNERLGKYKNDLQEALLLTDKLLISQIMFEYTGHVKK